MPAEENAALNFRRKPKSISLQRERKRLCQAQAEAIYARSDDSANPALNPHSFKHPSCGRAQIEIAHFCVGQLRHTWPDAIGTEQAKSSVFSNINIVTPEFKVDPLPFARARANSGLLLRHTARQTTGVVIASSQLKALNSVLSVIACFRQLSWVHNLLSMTNTTRFHPFD